MNLAEVNKRLKRIKISLQSDLYKVDQLRSAIVSEINKLEELKLEIATQVSPEELPEDDPLSELRRMIKQDGVESQVKALVAKIKKEEESRDHASFGKINRDEDGNPY